MLRFLATAGVDNPDTNSNNIIFIIKYKQKIMSLPAFIRKRQPRTIKTFYQCIAMNLK